MLALGNIGKYKKKIVDLALNDSVIQAPTGVQYY